MSKADGKGGGVRWMGAMLLPRWLLVAAVAFIAWQAIVFLRPKPRALMPAEAHAVTRVCAQAVSRLEASLQGPVRFGVLHLGGEGGEQATQLLRQALAEHRDWTVNESSVIQTFLHDVGEAVARATSLTEIVQAGRAVELDAVVGGSVRSLARGANDSASATLRIWVFDTRAGRLVLDDAITAEWRPRAWDRFTFAIAEMNELTRLAIWLVVVLALPWLTAGLTHRVLARRSNVASGLLILGYTLVGLALAGLLSGGSLSLLRALIATALGSIYNLFACERIAKM